MASTTITDAFSGRAGTGATRVILGLLVGFGITLFLFWLMQYMIETADRTLDEGSRGSLVDFVRIQRDETIERRQLKPKKPPPPESAPPQPPTPQLENLDPTAEKIAISAVPVTTEIEMSGGFSLGVGEGDYLPIRDPFVVESQCTSSLFHRASLQAALKFKYKPRIIDGEPVEVRGVQNKFTYEITE